MEEIFHRASIRKYLDKEVEEEKIKKILAAAMSAPSAMNGRPWEFYVVTNKEILNNLSEATQYSTMVKYAACAIVVCYRKEGIAEIYHDIDCALATENILLEIDHLGLGGVMIGVSPNEDKQENVERILNIPNTLRAFTIWLSGTRKTTVK